MHPLDDDESEFYAPGNLHACQQMLLEAVQRLRAVRKQQRNTLRDVESLQRQLAHARNEVLQLSTSKDHGPTTASEAARRLGVLSGNKAKMTTHTTARLLQAYDLRKRTDLSARAIAKKLNLSDGVLAGFFAGDYPSASAIEARRVLAERGEPPPPWKRRKKALEPL